MRRLVPATAFALALAAWPFPLPARAGGADLWQTYMDAALASQKAHDFKMEAAILATALDYAKRHDPKGQRPVLTRLPLILAYFALGEKALNAPLIKQGLHVNVRHLDPRLKSYIKTLDGFGWSYFGLWQTNAPSPGPNFRLQQDARLYGAQNSFRLEIALRRKLEPANVDGLALATHALGYVLLTESVDGATKVRRCSVRAIRAPAHAGADTQSAQIAYALALAEVQEAQRRRNAMATASRLFSVGEHNSSIFGRPVTANQMYLLILAGRGDVDCAWTFLNRKDYKSFVREIQDATKLLTETMHVTSLTFKSWQSNPFLAIVYYDLARLYGVEFVMNKSRPGAYPTALPKALRLFEKSLHLLTYSYGPHATYVHIVASDYVDLLVKAKKLTKAKEIEQRYSIPPPK